MMVVSLVANGHVRSPPDEGYTSLRSPMPSIVPNSPLHQMLMYKQELMTS